MGNAAPFAKQAPLLLPLSSLRAAGCFPRGPECAAQCVDARQVDRDSSLVVFVSHVWQRSFHGCEDWDGRPHPDHADKRAYKLCVAGISKIFKLMAPGMTQCYVWLDYSCLNQGTTRVSCVCQHLCLCLRDCAYVSCVRVCVCVVPYCAMLY